MLNNKHGVSLIQVIIAIVIIIIITSFAIWYASNTSTEAKLTRIYSEITAVKEAYENAKVLNEITPGTYSFVSKSSSQISNDYDSEDVAFLSSISDDSQLYLITPENAKNIDAEKIELEYIIDGKTDNIYLIGGFSRKDDQEPVYEYKDIVRLYNSTLK